MASKWTVESIVLSTIDTVTHVYGKERSERFDVSIGRDCTRRQSLVLLSLIGVARFVNDCTCTRPKYNRGMDEMMTSKFNEIYF